MAREMWRMMVILSTFTMTVHSQSGLFSRLMEDTSGVQYNFYNFRPPSSDFGGGGGSTPILQGDPMRRISDSFEVHTPPFSTSREEGGHEGYDERWGTENSIQGKPYEVEVDDEARRDWEDDWTQVTREPSRREPQPSAGKRETPTERGRWDRHGLPTDVSWNQHTVHGKSSRDGGRFGHKVTKMWHVMPQGGFIMTEQRPSDSPPHSPPVRTFGTEENDGHWQLPIPTALSPRPLSPTSNKRKGGGKRKVMSVLDINEDMMEQRLRRRIRKLRTMMQILQTRKNLKNLRDQ